MRSKKMGRPKIHIDQDMFEKLCNIMCTQTDIAGFFECSVDTIERWCKETYEVTFAEIYKKKCAKGLISLRRKQFEVAMGGNVSMLIWLGKNMLDQKDHNEQQFNYAGVSLSFNGQKLNKEKLIKE